MVPSASARACITNASCITMYYMRQILNISLPEEMAKDIKKEAKKRRFTVSEFVRAVIRRYQEDRLLKIVEEGRKAYREGRTLKRLPD